jgi:hypothetical protein
MRVDSEAPMNCKGFIQLPAESHYWSVGAIGSYSFCGENYQKCEMLRMQSANLEAARRCGGV